MGKARDANGVEELFDNSLCGSAAGLMAPADGTHGGKFPSHSDSRIIIIHLIRFLRKLSFL